MSTTIPNSQRDFERLFADLELVPAPRYLDKKQLKGALREVKVKYHPDRAGEDSGAVKRNTGIIYAATDAFNILTSPEAEQAWLSLLQSGGYSQTRSHAEGRQTWESQSKTYDQGSYDQEFWGSQDQWNGTRNSSQTPSEPASFFCEMPNTQWKVGRKISERLPNVAQRFGAAVLGFGLSSSASLAQTGGLNHRVVWIWMSVFLCVTVGSAIAGQFSKPLSVFEWMELKLRGFNRDMSILTTGFVFLFALNTYVGTGAALWASAGAMIFWLARRSALGFVIKRVVSVTTTLVIGLLRLVFLRK